MKLWQLLLIALSASGYLLALYAAVRERVRTRRPVSPRLWGDHPAGPGEAVFHAPDTASGGQ